MSDRLRLLLMAYQCAPEQGSVSQIGWEWYSRMANRAQVTLVTHIRNKKALDSKALPAPDAQVIFVDTEAFSGPLYRTASRLFPRSQHAVFLISSFDFFVFDCKATRMLRKMQSEGRSWDLAHMVTPVSPVATPTLHRLGVPLVLGPWNGGLKSPKTFPEFMSQDSAWLYPVRNLGQVLEACNGGIAAATTILTATEATDKSISPRNTSKCVRMLENGVDLSLFQALPWPPPPSATNPLRILFVGRLLPMKGIPMLIEALHGLQNSSPFELTIIGEGPERELLEHRASELGLSSCIHFLGARPLAEVATAMREAHVFCLPSVRESGGAVLLEAMAAARPVIAVKYGGPAEVVSEDVGHAIEPIGREHVCSELLKIFEEIIANPELWRKKGLAGRRRAELEFSWDAKIDSAINLYERILGTESRSVTASVAHQEQVKTELQANHDASMTRN
jgi:glycosyltransferase involved in cell wall biosynthesis